LHPTLQQALFNMRWTELRPLQIETIHAVLDGQEDLILSAPTAGGKTEAAFLPILSQLAEDFAGGVRALYIGPLKALINDQFRRLEELCALAQIPVHRWHGDIGQAARRALFERPGGVLLITPESVESLRINYAHRLPLLLGRLEYVVIDELHAFIGTERGAHLQSLLARLMQGRAVPPRVLALSATLGDAEAARRWLSPRTPERVRVVTDASGRDVRYLIQGYLRPASVDDEPTDEDRRLVADLTRAFINRTGLIFANSRKQLELLADLAARHAEQERITNRFRIHHGSLSKAEREATEDALRSDSPATTFCSSTLELGIDVGNVQAVGQIGAPWSVSALIQRLGRSGRREGEAAELRLYVVEEEPMVDARLVDRLFPELLQAVAMTELMLQGWCEPPEADRLHLSTLVQQVLSVIAERGGATAGRVFDTLITFGAFINVDEACFVQVLRSMGAADLIEQAPEGELILGLQGERIVRSLDFYAAFVTDRELQVFHGPHRIGSVSETPGMGGDGFLILAGRRWRILEVDLERGEILVEPSRGGKLPYFAGAGGSDIHPRVREEMRRVLFDMGIPRYLDSHAAELLRRGRAAAREAGLAERAFVAVGRDTVWFPWVGSRIQRTLAGLCRFAGLEVCEDEFALTFAKVDEPAVRGALASLLQRHPSVLELAATFPVKAQAKYDSFLSEELQTRLFAHNALDLEGAIETLRQQV
jgi:ATP-dependent Lhr-like helicase